tara:strand:+ start:7061 stop:7183 length:123 start_codon:yes stop_codon:yes gene_type:complete
MGKILKEWDGGVPNNGTLDGMEVSQIMEHLMNLKLEMLIR